MTQVYLKYALHYHDQYGLAVAFKAVNGTPLHEWRQYAETGMDAQTIRTLYFEHVEKKRRQAIRLAILTGPYMRNLEKPMLVIDVDEPPVNDEKEKMELMKTFAKEGYQVVNTPHGFHLHVLLEKPENLPYIFRIYREGEEKQIAIGEGGCLFPHPWSTVPSMRPLGENKWMRYSFVLPDGTKVSSYDDFLKHRHELEPSTMRLSDVIEDVSLLLSAKVKTFNPSETGVQPSGMPKVVSDEKEIGRKRPLFTTFEEFYASILNFPLPLCVAWVMYNFANETGDDFVASAIASYIQDMIPNLGKVPHGMRFLVSAAVGLFLAHVIEWIRFDEIISVLQTAVEDWPADDGYPLDRKLAYLFLSDDEGYVYPRYGGLGSMTPAQVWNCTELCPFGKMCSGRNPWRPFVRLVKRKTVAKMLLSASSEEEEQGE